MSELDSVIDKLASATVEDNKDVSFAGQGLKLDTEEDAVEVVNAIKNCPGMTSLCLEGNTVGVPAAKAIAKALESQSDFRKALWKDMFTRRTEHEIPDSLNFLSSGIMLANAHLSELDLSDNAFGPRGMKGIVNLLKSPPCFTLQELRLNNNGLGITGAKMLAAALLQCLENSTAAGTPLRLKLFICGRNRLENEGSLAMSEFIKNVKTLEVIAMPQNGIYHEGIAGLSAAFAENSELKVLNMEDNSLTEKGAQHIAKILPGLKNLEVLNLGDCLIRTGGAKSIAKAISCSCFNLKELLLGYNEISKIGGLDIAKAIENKNQLEKLVLNGNHFGSEGRQQISNVIADFDKSGAFASLSEDESSEDEDDGEEEYEDDEDEEYVKEVEIGEYISISDTEQNGDSHSMEKVTFSDFFSDPSEEKLLCLFLSQISILHELPESATWKNYFDLFLKVSSVITVDSTDLKAAIHYANEVLSAAFGACKDDEMWKFNNDFLVSLGLIKEEDKKNMVNSKDLSGALILLQHVVKSNYFPISTRDLLKLLLSKPMKYGVFSPKAVSSLLQILYQ